MNKIKKQLIIVFVGIMLLGVVIGVLFPTIRSNPGRPLCYEIKKSVAEAITVYRKTYMCFPDNLDRINYKTLPFCPVTNAKYQYNPPSIESRGVLKDAITHKNEKDIYFEY